MVCLEERNKQQTNKSNISFSNFKHWESSFNEVQNMSLYTYNASLEKEWVFCSRELRVHQSISSRYTRLLYRNQHPQNVSLFAINVHLCCLLTHQFFLILSQTTSQSSAKYFEKFVSTSLASTFFPLSLHVNDVVLLLLKYLCT